MPGADGSFKGGISVKEEYSVLAAADGGERAGGGEASLGVPLTWARYCSGQMVRNLLVHVSRGSYRRTHPALPTCL